MKNLKKVEQLYSKFAINVVDGEKTFVLKFDIRHDKKVLWNCIGDNCTITQGETLFKVTNRDNIIPIDNFYHPNILAPSLDTYLFGSVGRNIMERI